MRLRRKYIEKLNIDNELLNFKTMRTVIVVVVDRFFALSVF